MQALVNIPASYNKPKGKYIDLRPIRKAVGKINNVPIDKVIKFVMECDFEKDMEDEELELFIVNHFSKK